MNCPKCGAPNRDGQKFCGNCGAQMQQQQPNNETSFSYTGNAPIRKKKKGRGCLIAILIVVALFVLLVIAGIAISSGDSKKSSSSNKTKATKPEEKEYVDNIDSVATNPDDYKGKYIKFYGIVSSVEDADDFYGCQVFVDLDYNNSVLLEIPKDIMPEAPTSEDFLSIDAKIEDSRDGQTIMGVDSTWAYLKADSVEKTTYINSFGKADTTWEFADQTIDQSGIKIDVTKVEFAKEETRFYVTVTNNSSDTVNLWTSSAKVIQNGQQKDQTYGNYYENYPEVSSDIIPGVSSSGIMVFDAIDPSALQLYIEGASYNWDIELSPFVFDLAQ